MTWTAWFTRWLPIAAAGVTLLALLDPLEGFPLVLVGGVLAVMAAIQGRSRFTRLVVLGLVLAVVGVAAMLALSAWGGVGGDTGRSIWWLLAALPYPIGVLMYFVGTMLILRGRWTAERDA